MPAQTGLRGGARTILRPVNPPVIGGLGRHAAALALDGSLRAIFWINGFLAFGELDLRIWLRGWAAIKLAS